MQKIVLLFLGCCMCLSVAAQQSPHKDYRILHLNKKFTPEKGFRADNRFSRTAPGAKVRYNQDQYFLVQFEAIPDEPRKGRLRSAGITLLDYFPNYAYFAHFARELNSDELAVLGIRTVLPLDESLKLSPELYHDQIPPHALKGTTAELTLHLFAGADTTAVAKELSRLGVTLLEKTAAAEWRIAVPAAKFRQLANIKQVKYLEPVSSDPVPEREPEPKPDPEDVFSNEHGRSNYLNSGFNGLLYNGDGINVMVRENGMYKGPELQGRVISGSNEPGDPSSHASGVAGYLGAGGNVNPRDRSNAWGANILGLSGQNTYTLYDDPVKRIRVTNMSYGWPDEVAGYSSLSREHDNFIRTRPEAMLVYSSGNDGGTAAFGGKYNGISGWGNITGRAKHAKNLLVVSGTDYEDNFLDWTCKGPAYDGRVKPELTIEGQGGTSFAAPKVSGIFTILHQAYKTEKNAALVPSALIKAVLMNTADDVYNPGIDFKTGYGRPNVRRAYQVIHNGQYQSGSIANGTQQSFPIAVPAGTSQLRVMLYWADYEAASGAAQALVNDVDLRVADPGGAFTLPWVLDTTANAVNLNLPATRGADHINNAEQVTIDNPAAGTYTLHLDGFNIPQGPQEFFLVYEFVQEGVTISYPAGGEAFGTGQQQYIRWDAYGAPGTFDLSYSTDNGATWNTIATGIAADKRQYKWTVPELNAKALIRVTRGGQTSTSGDVHVLNIPSGLKLDWVCGSNLQLVWRKMPQAAQYEVFRLGAKYMEPIGTTSDTLFIFAAADSTLPEWYAVRAITAGGVTGLRCNALKKEPGSFDCQNLLTGPAFFIQRDKATLTGRVNPLGQSLTDVTFEYGPTSAFGSSFVLPQSFSGTVFQQVSQEVPIAMQSNQTWYYRLKATLNGTIIYSDAQTFQPAPGNSMKFNGDGIMTLGPNDAVNGNKPRTIELWVKTSVYNADGGAISLPGGSGTTRGDFTLGTNGADNQWKLSLWNVTRTYTLPGNKGEWHHLALTYNPTNTTAELYYDGTLFDTWNTGGALTTLPGNIRLGVRANGGNFYYNGEMDEVRIWSTVRTAAQIRENMHHPLKGTETGLVYYVDFDNMVPETYELITKKVLGYTGNLQKIKAHYPFGQGATVNGTEAAGTVTFGNNANVTANYAAQAARAVSFSRIDLTSAVFTGTSTSAVKLADEFWVGHRYTTAGGALNMQLAFKSAADLTATDAANPGKIYLFTRQPYTDGAWQYSGTASSVDDAGDSIRVNGLTAYQQYMFMKDENAFVFAAADSLLLSDARPGAVTPSASFGVSGYNLPDSLVVTAPAGYEVSADNLAFTAAPLSVPVTNGAVKDLKVYVRFAPTAAQAYNGIVRLVSGGVLLDSVRVSQQGIAVDTTAGKAMSFDGTGDYLEIQNLNWKPTEFTLEWWLKAKSTKDYNQQIGNGWGSFLSHAGNDKGASFGVANNANSRIAIPGAYNDLDTWHHYAFTFRNGEAKVYRDGKLIDSRTASSLPAQWNTFRLGTADGNTLHGELEEFRMWSVARTQQEIRENMHLTARGDEPGLKVYLQFQDAARDVTDLSANAYPVRLFGNTVRVTSNAPVAAGISETRAVNAAGTLTFEQTGLALTYANTGVYPKGEVVISRLQSPATGVNGARQYWVVRNYGDSTANAISTLQLLQNADSLSNVRLQKRAFNATGTWSAGLAGNSLTFNIAATDIRNSQVAFAVTANNAPVFTAPAHLTVYRNDTCGYNADTSVTGVPKAVSDDSGLPPQISFADMVIDTAVIRTWTATDNMGHRSSQQQTIFIKDSTAPAVQYADSLFRCYDASGSYSLPALQASDNCGVDSIRYTISGATARAGSGANAGGVFNAGTSLIDWVVTDKSGNATLRRTVMTVNNPLQLSIPHAFAVSPGGAPNTIYLGYGPASITLAGQVSGGTAPYTYAWSSGSTQATATVQPATAGQHSYTLTVTDAKGCTISATHVVTVSDIRCGNGWVTICHKGSKTQCIPSAEVANHLEHGCQLGACEGGASTKEEISAEVQPNPTATEFVLKVKTHSTASLLIRVYNLQGQLVDEITAPAGQQIRFGQSYKPGLYITEIRQGNLRKTMKLIKL